MKRDMDLVRLLLLDIEADQLLVARQFRQQSNGYAKQQIWDHLVLMRQGGLVWQDQLVKFYTSTGEESGSVPTALTWHGCEFLDQIRDEHVWGKVKGIALSATGGLSLEVIKYLIPEAIKQLIKP